MKVRSFVVSVIGLVLLAGGACTPPIPTSTVDQEYSGTLGPFQFVNCTAVYGQSFTAGRTGKVDKISLKLQMLGTATATVKVVALDPVTLQPTGPILGSGSSTGPFAGLGAFTDIKLPTAAPVTAGSTYLIIIEPTDCTPGVDAFDIGAVFPGSYPGGSVFLLSGFGWEDGSYDFEFRTWVR